MRKIYKLNNSGEKVWYRGIEKGAVLIHHLKECGVKLTGKNAKLRASALSVYGPDWKTEINWKFWT